MSSQNNNQQNQSHTNTPDKKPPSRKSNRGGWLFILAALVVIIIITLKESRKSIDWIDDYQTGIQQAQEQNQPALLLFVSTDPSFAQDCDRMLRETYGDPSITKYIMKTFVPILLDADENKQLLKKYDIKTFPTQTITLTTNNKTSEIAGFVSPTEFPGRINRALQRLKQNAP